MRLTLALLCSLLVVPAALAAPKATGDGVFELQGVDASKIIINGNRGAIWGQLDSGTLRVTDMNLGDNLQPQVSGAEYSYSTLDPGVKIYSGKNIHFRFSGGKYRFVIVNALGVDVTAVGVGQVTLTGDPNSFDPGSYAIDDGKWQPVPLIKRLLTFGVQPVTTTTTTP